MIRRARIIGYKSLADCEVKLAPLSVIFGPNAAGKSNFLDALQLLSRAVTARTLNDAFEPPYRGLPLESFSFEKGGIAAHLERESLCFSIEIDIDLSNTTVERVEQRIRDMRAGQGGDIGGKKVTERLLRYRLAIEILPRSGILRVKDEYLAALRGDGERKESRKPFISPESGKLRLRLEGQAHPTDHDISLDHTLTSLPLYPPHYPHITAFKEELSTWAFFYFEPRERMRATNPVKQVRHIGPMGDDLAAFLNTLQTTDPRRLKNIAKALHTLVPRVTDIQVEPNNLGEVELRLVEDGVGIPARLASEGTLRMLGLLAVASSTEPSSLIAFEEPENGIHPRRIRLLAEFLEQQGRLGDRQFIITTHSPLLADLMAHETLFVSQREGAHTVITPLLPRSLFALKRDQIAQGLDDEADDPRPKISERILRGDFDA